MRGPSWDLSPESMRRSSAHSSPANCSTWWRPCRRSEIMANVLLGVTGSVAAIRIPDLYSELKRAGHQVKVVATQASLYFFDPAVLDPLDSTLPFRNPSVVVLDVDEWPGRGSGKRCVPADAV